MKSTSLVLILLSSQFLGGVQAVAANEVTPSSAVVTSSVQGEEGSSSSQVSLPSSTTSVVEASQEPSTQPGLTEPTRGAANQVPASELPASKQESHPQSEKQETGSTAAESNQDRVPLYRLYHPGLKVHLYTKDSNEYAILGNRGWKQEGLAWNTAGQQGDTVYRLYHTGLKVHLYTKDTNEYAILATRGWKQEGPAFRSYGTIPIYRLYHTGLRKHLYTKDTNEYAILATRGWKQEGLAFFGLDAGSSGQTPPSSNQTPPSSTPPSSTPPSSTVMDSGVTIYQHSEYGPYVSAVDFGADRTGKKSSSEAINQAIRAAHQHKVALYLGEGEFYITQSILLDDRVGDVTAVFGAGMEKTKIRFDWAQGTQTNNAGILIKGLNNKVIGDIAVQYTGEYYRAQQAYFGLIDGIQLDHTDHTTVQRVDVSGANRSGVRFDSIRYYAQNIKDGILTGRIQPQNLDFPENNRILDSRVHHNRVAGIFGTFQKNLTVTGNTMSYNGHQNDGNAGYGFALGVGSYNEGITLTNNRTLSNYRKGIDVHDGDRIFIKNNTLDSDRLFGIGIVARTFAMRQVTIQDNVITFDPVQHVFTDDTEPRNVAFKEYWAIDLQTNYDKVGHHNGQAGQFIIHNNTVKGLKDNPNDPNVRINAIRFGFHDHHPYSVQLTNNTVLGSSADRFILLSSQSRSAGKITVSHNQATVPVVGRLFGLEVRDLPQGSNLLATNNSVNGKVIGPQKAQ